MTRKCRDLNSNDRKDLRSSKLLSSVFQDKIIWRLEKNEKYSVKSAYRYCIEDTLDISHLQVQGNWNLIWQIQAPPKIKKFIWRLCRNCIPTRTRLLQKGADIGAKIHICNSTLEHVAQQQIVAKPNRDSICSLHGSHGVADGSSRTDKKHQPTTTTSRVKMD
ncbi:hypothetical protein TSUD_57600 [Trifolium subterraneum]|uniref:Reverse transcriptase zinc-binding domain-containing protein n=1 Tax=Trifolium subterraneum TaxID=3900 RepID=A0A2Z6NFB0_TRISU|nr:hypothetical protein TSUD_57600 [Trifolium subterraneum]